MKSGLKSRMTVAMPENLQRVGKDKRRTELGLLIFASALIGCAYLLAALGVTRTPPANIWPFFGMVIALLMIAHLFVRNRAPMADPLMLPCAALLNGFGYVMILRLDSNLAAQQAMWTALGIGAFVATLVLIPRARDLQRYRYVFALVGIVLLLLPMVPGIGRTVNGARLWVYIGPVSFQPGEVVKVTLAIFMASYLVEKRELMAIGTRRIGKVLIPDLKHFGPVIFMWGICMLVLLVQRDLGSSLLYLALFVSMLWVATGRTLYPAVAIGLFGVGFLFALKTFSYVQARINSWLDPWSIASGQGFQSVQSWYALGAGKTTGTGLGLGSPTRIPYVETDFIIAAIGEELGLLGTASVVIAYIVFIGNGYRIATIARHPFEKLLACGLTTIVGFQAFIIMAGVTRLLPLTGITLPFVSYGGSSLLTNWVIVALLLRISHDSNLENSLSPNRGIDVKSGVGR